MTRVLKADAQDALTEAVAVLKGGGLVAYPSDTVYGLGAAASDERAVARVFAVKGRPSEKALPLLLAEAEDMAPLCAEVPAAAKLLVEHFWPGPLTLVLRRSPTFHSAALGGGEKVALRVPDHPLLRELIRALGEPITGTSANRSGRPSCRTAAEVEEELADAVDLIIDGGPSRAGQESTVVDITEDTPRIMREGAISRREIEKVLGQGVEV
ncbi:MAG: L-threonylcarbamoyladenylate synthase [Dehalococcoidia bacterium]|nr:L-threonylcarbamoyladenylate synthase [Dehalococcoidia bacterium]